MFFSVLTYNTSSVYETQKQKQMSGRSTAVSNVMTVSDRGEQKEIICLLLRKQKMEIQTGSRSRRGAVALNLILQPTGRKVANSIATFKCSM